jgi:hypothetical protein
MDTADHLLFKVKSWSGLRKWFESYVDCDDGYLAEGVSDYVAVSLAQCWQGLPELERQVKSNPRFEAFVLQHIDATADSDDLEAIVEHATKRCPNHSIALCSSIISAARKALEEIHDVNESQLPDQIDAEPPNQRLHPTAGFAIRAVKRHSVGRLS